MGSGHLTGEDAALNPLARKAGLKGSELAQDGLPSDRIWLGELYDAHSADVRRVLRRMLGFEAELEDALQDVFLIALRRRSELEKAGVPPGPWLYGVAVRTALALRRRRRVREFFGLEAARHVAADADPASDVARSEASRTVYSALEKLSAKKRTVFVLFELKGMQGEEIAQLLGIPLKTVWSRLLHARKEFATAVQRLNARQEGER